MRNFGITMALASALALVGACEDEPDMADEPAATEGEEEMMEQRDEAEQELDEAEQELDESVEEAEEELEDY
ncbi:MAG: hypothetical protein ACODAU_09255 [Myxococcota bacterium]